MRVLKDVAERLSCFVLGVDHYGKNMDAGLKGSVAKETQGDLVLVCLGERERSGRVVNTRLAVRKCRGGVQGQEFPFTTRVVEHPEKDEDGEAITTLVIDWQPVPPGGAQPQAEPDPWAQGRRQEQRTAALRLKRVLMGILADQGVELPIPPDGPVVRMVAQKIVQKEFYTHTPADGSPEQKRKIRHQQFSRALAWAEDKQIQVLAHRRRKSANKRWRAPLRGIASASVSNDQALRTDANGATVLRLVVGDIIPPLPRNFSSRGAIV